MASSEKPTEPESTFAVLPLWKSFWVGLLGAALLGAVIPFLLNYSRGALALNMSDNVTEIVGWMLFVPFYLLLMVSLWKCAYNTSNALWGHLARTYAILTSLLFIAIFITAIFD